MKIKWFNSEIYCFTGESVKKQITDSICKNLTDSDLESTHKIGLLMPDEDILFKIECINNKNYPWRKYLIGIHSEPTRSIPNQSEKRFVTRLMKNGKKSIQPNPIYSESIIRINPNQSETKFSIRIFNQN